MPVTTQPLVRRAAIPQAQDPFINTPLISLGLDESGTERFWTSSWNSNAGTIGVVVGGDGEFRVHRFPPPHNGFYSAVAEDPDTLWLCGDLSRVVRFSVSTGEYESFETGAPAALMFSGMSWDPVTRKLFAAAFPPPHRVGFCFDTVTRTTTAIHRDFVEEHYQRANFDNGDGTRTTLMVNPGLALVRWDPESDGLEVRLAHDQRPDLPRPFGYPASAELAPAADGRIYVSGCGWLDPASGEFSELGPFPDRELIWIAFRGNRAWGVEQKSAEAVVSVWDLATGEIRELCTIPDGTPQGIRLSAAGKLVAVSVYGEFSRHDAETGAVEFVRQLPTDSVARVDCLRRIDDRRVLGTPFITQRFWSVDLETGEGEDLGRAAPGGGEILRTWLVDGKVYLAAYAGGQLTEYDPEQPSAFPTNPRVVADPGNGMRPIADALDGRVLYYASSHHYGELGGVITRYDTATGEATYFDDPLPNLAIQSLVVEPAGHVLVAGSRIEADCQSAPPVATAAAIAQIDPVTMRPLAVASAEDGVEAVSVVAALGDGRVVCQAKRPADAVPCWFLVSTASTAAFAVPPVAAWLPLPGPTGQAGDGAPTRRMIATERSGLVVLDQGEGRYESWQVGEGNAPAPLHTEPGAYHVEVQGDDLLIATPDTIIVVEGVFASAG